MGTKNVNAVPLFEFDTSVLTFLAERFFTRVELLFLESIFRKIHVKCYITLHPVCSAYGIVVLKK